MRTVPIVLGSRWTKSLLLLLIGFCMAMLCFLLFRFIFFSVTPPDYISLVYFMIFLIIPLLLLGVQVVRARNKRGFHRASTLIKLVMLTGILYTLLVFYLVNFKY